MLRVVNWVSSRVYELLCLSNKAPVIRKKKYIYIYIVNLQPARSKFDSSN